MPQTKLAHGPYALTSTNAALLPNKPGAYALGATSTTGSWTVQYVGRSDTDVSGRIAQWVGNGYREFKYTPYSSAADAFNHECYMYHAFGESQLLDNKVHPASPAGTNWTCQFE